MRMIILTAVFTATLAAATGAGAVSLAPADGRNLTALPDDFLDDIPSAGAAPDAGRTDNARRWEDSHASAAGETRAPVPGVDCAKPSGTTGAILGAVAGGLLGNVIDGGRHRAAGTLIGGGGGALLGREIEQRSAKCK
ncbi:glycine zipper 2TM domain-containing protein [Sphingomonadaceae bacterium G21617-S1]|uniref:glycine zipper 2TM domain-containing protein n=1 Tax=Rhizorhabdus sp. TaxID=1968843 RepID=UPI0022BD3CCA|nr:glycine zipper 2TM domain-containing protein [Rhizorhabdus sp.]MCZ4342412.1 glycine zipper 2TM domain-containing protein [Sphingomonadaceae bacterium G21617-S1]